IGGGVAADGPGRFAVRLLLRRFGWGARRADGRSRRRATRGEFPDRLPRCRFVEGRRLSGTRLRLGRNTTEPAFPADMPHRFAVCTAPLLSDLYDGKRPFPDGSIPRKGAFRAVWACR